MPSTGYDPNEQESKHCLLFHLTLIFLDFLHHRHWCHAGHQQCDVAECNENSIWNCTQRVSKGHQRIVFLEMACDDLSIKAGISTAIGGNEKYVFS